MPTGKLGNETSPAEIRCFEGKAIESLVAQIDPVYEDLRMKRIQTAILKAPKLQGDGEIGFLLWVDSECGLYVQLAGNAAAGTYGGLLFSVSRYAGIRKDQELINKLTGYDLEKCQERDSANNNDGAFLKAVLCHLLPD